MLDGFILLASETTTDAAQAAIDLNSEIANFGPLEFLMTGGGLIILSAIFVLPLFLAAIPANIAKKKGRNFAGYYLFGYFALIPAIIVTLIQKPIPQEELKKKSMSEIARGR